METSINRAAIFALVVSVMTASADRCSAGLWDRITRPQTPELRAVAAGRFLFITDYEFDRAAETARELRTVGDRLNAELDVPRLDETVRVYIFQSHREYARYVQRHIPHLTDADLDRPAIFLRRADKSYLFAVKSEHLTADLRHEYVHAVLNAHHENLPIWLDEGLAQYYETGREDGWHSRSVRWIESNRDDWQPDLNRLKAIRSMSQMGRREYAEAWWWTHRWMTNSDASRQVLREYLAGLRRVTVVEPSASRGP